MKSLLTALALGVAITASALLAVQQTAAMAGDGEQRSEMDAGKSEMKSGMDDREAGMRSMEEDDMRSMETRREMSEEQMERGNGANEGEEHQERKWWRFWE